MIKIIIWIILLIIFATLYFMNDIAEKYDNKRNINQLAYISSLKLILPTIKLFNKEEYYKPKQFFIMNDFGIKLNEDPGEIKFQEIGNINDYYL